MYMPYTQQSSQEQFAVHLLIFSFKLLARHAGGSGAAVLAAAPAQAAHGSSGVVGLENLCDSAPRAAVAAGERGGARRGEQLFFF